MQLKKTKKQHRGQGDLSQVLENQRVRNELLGEPAHRLPDQESRRISEVLPHANMEGPGGENLRCGCSAKVEQSLGNSC